MPTRPQNGFSALEFLAATGIVLVITAIVTAGLLSFRASQELNSAAGYAAHMLNEARAKTMRSEADSKYGVHFEAARLTLFKGDIYNASDPNNQNVYFSKMAEMSSASLNGGGADVIFERLSGKTANYGSVTFRLKSDAAKTKTVTIYQSGIIEIN